MELEQNKNNFKFHFYTIVIPNPNLNLIKNNTSSFKGNLKIIILNNCYSDRIMILIKKTNTILERDETINQILNKLEKQTLLSN